MNGHCPTRGKKLRELKKEISVPISICLFEVGLPSVPSSNQKAVGLLYMQI